MATKGYLKGLASKKMFERVTEIALKYSAINGVLKEEDAIWLIQVDIVEYFLATLEHGLMADEETVLKVKQVLES
jgi:hypothetical protein